MAVTVPIGSQVTKDPEAQRVYEIDWTHVLDGEAIASSEWEIEGPDGALTVDEDGVVGALAHARLIGGTPGAVYRVKNTITFDTPTQTEPGSFFVFIGLE